MNNSSHITDQEKVPFAVELRVADLEVSLGFYSKLDFKILRLDEGACFAALNFQGALLMLEQGEIVSPKGQGVDLRFYLKDGLREFYDRVKREGLLISREYEETAYGLAQFCVSDPDGYVLRFCMGL